jgi:hypothetical protein
MLLLRHWRSAQLWLLDLYVRERRGTLPAKPPPFLSLPLTGPDGIVADSDAVLGRFGSTRRLWVQGGTGMGKTAIFLHLVQTHFGGIDATSFTIFRRDGYVLVPIEARASPKHLLMRKVRRLGSSPACSASFQSAACLSRIEAFFARCSTRVRSQLPLMA